MSGGDSDVQIRSMRADDLPRVLEIERALKDAPQWSLRAWKRAVDPEAARQRIAMVAEDPQAGVVGFVVASIVLPEAELESIAVVSGWQRRRVARLLFGELADRLRQAGAWEIFLEFRASNQAARGFYQALGFAEAGRRARYYADPEEDAVLMRLPL
jgi:ribosomal-protein-alanine N-acetyltransferase